MIKRDQTFVNIGSESGFLWGPRQCGKSTLLKALFPKSPYYDLLLAGDYGRLSRHPSLLREETLSRLNNKAFRGTPIIIDEVQKIPALLDEIQWLMVNHPCRFILCGSSARKLKRGGGNLLGGRALRYELFPLTSHEIPDFDLIHALNHGLLPRHYLATNQAQCTKMLEAYVGEYLKEEISSEALVRNMPAFSRFLEVAAFSNGEMVNYENIASECGVSAPTVRGYFQILEDTLLGRFIESFRNRPKRRVIQTPKFYFFDVGLVNFLLRRTHILPKTEIFGRAFEHFIYQELTSHRHYSGKNYPVQYWRTASQFEVDFILGDGQVAVEVKGVEEVRPHHLKGLRAFCEDHHPKRAIVVSLDQHPRQLDRLEIIPVQSFLKLLWDGEII